VHSLQIEADPDVVQLVPTNPTANVCGANDNSARDQIIEDALADYRSVLDGGGRHHGFFNAIRKIYVDAGVPLHELRPYMARCDYDGHQKKRYHQIIKDLSTGRYGTPKATNMFLAGMASKFGAGLAK